MLIVVILLSCAIGVFSGLFQLVFLGATVMEAGFTYLSVSLLLSTLAIVAAVLRSGLGEASATSTPTTAQWRDWHEEEDWADAAQEPEKLQAREGRR